MQKQFSNPSLADGRDLLLNIIPREEEDWRPSMNLSDLIKRIPQFITDVIKQGDQYTQTIGKFHLGLQYDMNIWFSNSQNCGVFPCQEDKDTFDKSYKKKN